MKTFLCSVSFLVLASACSSTPKTSNSNVNDWPEKVIDAHTHTAFDNQTQRSSGFLYSKEQYLKELKESNVVGAVSMNGKDGSGYIDLSAQNVIHCAGVKVPVELKRVRDGLKSKKYSCIKIYLGYVHAFASDARYQPLYRLAREFKVPVVFHTGDTYSTKGKLKYSDPLTIDEVAVDYPDVTFVIAHIGNPWIQSAAEVAYKNPNVVIDGSALLIGKLSDYSKEELEKYVIEPLRWTFGYIESPKKLMFGTDWPLVSIRDYLSVFKQAIPKEHWNEVFYENAKNVFHFKK